MCAFNELITKLLSKLQNQFKSEKYFFKIFLKKFVFVKNNILYLQYIRNLNIKLL